MVKSVSFVSLLLTITMVTAREAAPENTTVTIMTFNIYHGATMNGNYDLDIIAQIIRAADPDLVALQEVDYHTNRSGGIDLVTELGQRTGLLPFFAPAMEYSSGYYGVGILSRTPVVSFKNHPLPHLPGNEPRTAAMVVTVLATGDTIAFISTHLDYKQEPMERLQQVEILNNLLPNSKYPLLLAGDLNSTPESAPINQLEQYWLAAYDKSNPRPTFPSNIPDRKIDYIMAYPPSTWQVVETAVIADSVASDHCAYRAVLKLTK